MDELVQDDKKYFLFLNNLGSTEYDHFWIFISKTWVWIPLYVVFIYLLYKKFGGKNLLYILIFIALGVTASDQLANIFKYGVARLRPCHDPVLEHHMRVVQCGGKFGFYSAHASNTFLLASYLVFLMGRSHKFLVVFLIIWASIVSYSRIYLGVHFPLDVLCGAMMGVLLGIFFSFLAKYTIYKRRLKV